MADDDLTLCDACSIELEAEGEKVIVELGSRTTMRSRGMACYFCPACIELPLRLTVVYKSRGQVTHEILVENKVDGLPWRMERDDH